MAETGGGGLNDRIIALPLSRLLFVLLLVCGFAVGFAELVERAERPGLRQSASAPCGEAAGFPCPSRAAMD